MDDRPKRPLIADRLVGLDARPRPASWRDRLSFGLKQSAPFSSLQRRIIVFNLLGLALLLAGVLYLNQFRTGLIDQRVQALRTQAELIAITVAETSALETGEPDMDPDRANVVLNRLVQPTGLRARLFDRRLRLTGDTRSLSPAGAPIEVLPLTAPGEDTAASLMRGVEDVYRGVTRFLGEPPPVYVETARAGISRDQEVLAAARGETASAVRVNSEDELIVSVAVPVTRFRAILGVLVLSTEGGDINDVVRKERTVILQVFIVASLVSVVLSVLLANTIARPIRRLARAAESEGTSAGRPLNPEKIEIPDMTRRSDEIGELSAALIRMTEALYKRIEAIESFAADVAHEIKNPLTSLRSAVETMNYAKTDAQRDRLLEVIKHDVSRMDRLVTDISNASRIDAELVRERMESFDISKLIEMLAEVTRTQGAERDVWVETRLPPGGLTATGLEGRLAQVITNLLDNALSFSPKGSSIVIRAHRTEKNGVRIAVEDQGRGIPEENLASIFERFYSERPEEEAFGNHSGLGLSICRQIVEAHGGTITASNIRRAGAPKDSPPEGARFTIELPK